jgi:hypothetical protein
MPVFHARRAAQAAAPVAILSVDLLNLALRRTLVGAPSKQLRAMPEPVAGHMVEANFDNQF